MTIEEKVSIVRTQVVLAAEFLRVIKKEIADLDIKVCRSEKNLQTANNEELLRMMSSARREISRATDYVERACSPLETAYYIAENTEIEEL